MVGHWDEKHAVVRDMESVFEHSGQVGKRWIGHNPVGVRAVFKEVSPFGDFAEFCARGQVLQECALSFEGLQASPCRCEMLNNTAR